MNTQLRMISLMCIFAAFVHARELSAGETIMDFEVVSLPKIKAMRLLNDPRMLSDSATMHKIIKDFKSQREAEVVATPSLTGTLPFRTKATGKVSVEADVGRTGNGLVSCSIAVESGKPKQSCRLVTAVDVKPGSPKFLGTLEPLEPAARDRTWLVFLHLR